MVRTLLLGFESWQYTMGAPMVWPQLKQHFIVESSQQLEKKVYAGMKEIILLKTKNGGIVTLCLQSYIYSCALLVI
jgi:hypothetical protein